MALRFLTEFDPQYGAAVDVLPGVTRVVADNPSKYTAWGTGTYLVGDAELAVIDPGPQLESHVDALLSALRGRRVTHVLVTHTHADHSPAARAISAATGAPTYGFGPHPPEASSGDPAAAGDGETDESGDLEFDPDVVIRDGDVLEGDGFSLECLHTPGHISNHVCFAERERNLLFPGDHVMGWSTTVVSPPDGNMTDYVANLRRLIGRGGQGLDRTYLPTHGPPIDDPVRYVQELVAHREARDRQILDVIDDRPCTVEEIVAELYADVRPELHAPAGRSVLAHLIGLQNRGLVAPTAGDRWSPT